MTSLSRCAVAVMLATGLATQLPGCVRVGTGEADPRPIDRSAATAAPQRATPEPAETRVATPAASAESDESTSEERVERGDASWYGEAHHGKATASGEPFDMYAMTAAHPTLELGTRVEVENLSNGRSVIVRINDRGPYTQDRVIDVSMAAAQALGFVGAGTAEVEIRLLR